MKVAFYGRFSDSTGWGTAARAYVHALHAAGIELSTVDVSRRSCVSDPLVRSLLNRKLEPDFHFYNFLPISARPLTLYFQKVILCSVWETESLPDEWLDVFERQLNRPVFRWPYPLRPEFMRWGLADRSGLAMLKSSDFVFYSIFVWQERKNPEGIIEAFLRAFTSSDDAVLILKVRSVWEGLVRRNGEAAPQDVLRSLRHKTGSDARIHVIEEIWSEEQIEALEQRGDCYVSMHRGEGWGYPLFNAAARRKPVIATGYSGSCDFLRADSHYFIRYRYVPVRRDDRLNSYTRDMLWADPDPEHCAELMRKVYNDRVNAVKRATAAAVELKSRYSAEAIGGLARDRLAQLLHGHKDNIVNESFRSSVLVPRGAQ